MSQHALFAEFLNSGLKVSPSSPLGFTNWSGGDLGNQVRFEKNNVFGGQGNSKRRCWYMHFN